MSTFDLARTNIVSKSGMDKFIISPLTNERIPADKLHEHVRYSTVDPQYKEQRDRYARNRSIPKSLLNYSYL